MSRQIHTPSIAHRTSENVNSSLSKRFISFLSPRYCLIQTAYTAQLEEEEEEEEEERGGGEGEEVHLLSQSSVLFDSNSLHCTTRRRRKGRGSSPFSVLGTV